MRQWEFERSVGQFFYELSELLWRHRLYRSYFLFTCPETTKNRFNKKKAKKPLRNLIWPRIRLKLSCPWFSRTWVWWKAWEKRRKSSKNKWKLAENQENRWKTEKTVGKIKKKCPECLWVQLSRWESKGTVKEATNPLNRACERKPTVNG